MKSIYYPAEEKQRSAGKMDCGVKQLVGFIKAIIIKITVDPVKFVFMEISKFMLVLALAFWITVGIFLMWESIMPESAQRLSAAAAAVVANSGGLLPNDENKDLTNEQGNYPFVVDLPNPASSAMETNVKEETSPQTLALETPKEEPDASAKQPDALKTESAQEVTIDGASKPLATSTPNNSAIEVTEQPSATAPEIPSAQPTEPEE